MNARGLLLCIACVGVCVSPVAGCSEDRDTAQLTLYEDPQGLFSLMIPAEWEIAPEVSAWRLYVGESSGSGERRFDATVGLTSGRPPCDWLQVDDVVGWYVDRRSAGAGYNQLSRVETEIDGRRAVQVEYELSRQEGPVSRELTWFTEAYGTVWQVTCTAFDGERYSEYVAAFMAIGRSFRVHGSWFPAG